jgi:DNA-binding PadR family transcriptional regulator
MHSAEESALTRSEWIVLSLVCEGPTHGNAVSRLLGADGELGRIWRVPKSMVYRSLDRLSDFGLARFAGEETTHQGPVRFLIEATEAGQAAAVSWQHLPVQHTRDIRSELLIKLALLDRSGADPHELLVAQHALLTPLADALRDRLATATGFDRTLLLWRYETASAAVRFLDGLLLTVIRIPKLGPGWGYQYEKFHRTAQSWATVGVAALARRDNGTVAEVRIGLTNMSPVPVRATAAEQAASEAAASRVALTEAAARADEGIEPPGDLHGAPDYRRHLARVLTGRALVAAARV